MRLSFRSVATAVFAGTTLAASALAAAVASASNGSIAQVNTALLTPGAYSFAGLNDDLHYRTAGVSSSSDAIDTELSSLSANSSFLEGSGSGQYPTRRRRSYGHSRYEDRMHNADGSTKIAFIAGGGLNLPVGNTGKFYTPSYALAVGAGLNLNRQFGLLAEFHYDHAGLTGGALNYEYQNLVNTYGATANDLAGFDGNSHFLAITVNPVISFADSHRSLGAYLTGGVGYYHKATNFTLPQVGSACNSYYCYSYTSNVNFDTYTANSFGVNGGFGLTYKLSEFSSERLFVEARYHWLNIGNNASPEFFPFNRRNSEYVPILVGIRF